MVYLFIGQDLNLKDAPFSSKDTQLKQIKEDIFNLNIGIGTTMRKYFMVIKSPYSRKSDIAFFKTPPDGAEIVSGVGAAYRSIKLMTGKPPARELLIPLGIMTVKVKQPEYKAGKSGAISYKMNRAAKKGKATGSVRIVT